MERARESKEELFGVTLIKSKKEPPFRESEDELKGKAVLFCCWRAVSIGIEQVAREENRSGQVMVAGIVRDIDLVKNVAVVRIIGGDIHQRYLQKEREIFFSSFRKLTEEETLAYSI